MSADKVTQLVNMGFEKAQATQALVACNDVLELAILHLFGEDATPMETGASLATEHTNALEYDTVKINNPSDIPDLSQYTRGKQSSGLVTYQAEQVSDQPVEGALYDVNLESNLDSGLNSRVESRHQTPSEAYQTAQAATMRNWEQLQDSYYSENQVDNGDTDSYMYNVYEKESSVLDYPERFELGEQKSPVALANGKFLEGYLVPLFTVLAQLNIFDKTVFELALPDHEFVYNPDWFCRKSDIIKIQLNSSEAVSSSTDPRIVKYVLLLQLLVAYLRSGESTRAFAFGNFITDNIPSELRQSLSTVDDVQEMLLSFYRSLEECYQAITASSEPKSLLKLFESEIKGQEESVNLLCINLDSEDLAESGGLQQWLNKVFVMDDETGSFSYVAPILTFSIKGDGDDSFNSQDYQIDEFLYPHLYTSKYLEVIEHMKSKREQLASDRQAQNQELLGLTSFEGLKVSKLLSRAIDCIGDSDAKNDLLQIQECLKQEKSTLTHKLMTGSSQYAGLDVQDVDNILHHLQQNNIELPAKYILAGIVVSPVEYFVREPHSVDSWRYVKESHTNTGSFKDYLIEEGLSFDSVQCVIKESILGYLIENAVVLMYVEESVLFEDDDFAIPDEIAQFLKKDNEQLAKHKKDLDRQNIDTEIVEISDDDNDADVADDDNAKHQSNLIDLDQSSDDVEEIVDGASAKEDHKHFT